MTDIPKLKVFDPRDHHPEPFDVDKVRNGQGRGAFYYVVGPSGAGKSTALSWVISSWYNKHPPYVFDNVLIFSGTAFNGAYQKWAPAGSVREEFDEEVLKDFMEKQKKKYDLIRRFPEWAEENRYGDANPHALLILDDLFGSVNLAGSMLLVKLAAICRHYFITCFVSVQDVCGLSRQQRECAHGALIFATNGLIANQHVCDSFCQWAQQEQRYRYHRFHRIMDYYLGGRGEKKTRAFLFQLRDPLKSAEDTCFVGKVPVDPATGEPDIAPFHVGRWTGQEDSMDEDDGGVIEATEPSQREINDAIHGAPKDSAIPSDDENEEQEKETLWGKAWGALSSDVVVRCAKGAAQLVFL